MINAANALDKALEVLAFGKHFVCYADVAKYRVNTIVLVTFVYVYNNIM